MRNLFKSLTFWTLFVGVVFFALTWYVPNFPLTQAQVLSLVLFVLGLIGVYPAVKDLGVRALATPPIINSLAFLELVAGLVAFIWNSVSPDAPITREVILGAFLAILALFQVHPELRARGIR